MKKILLAALAALAMCSCTMRHEDYSIVGKWECKYNINGYNGIVGLTFDSDHVYIWDEDGVRITYRYDVCGWDGNTLHINMYGSDDEYIYTRTIVFKSHNTIEWGADEPLGGTEYKRK